MMRALVLTCSIAIVAGACASFALQRSSETLGGRIEEVVLQSEVFGNSRTLRVWLPPGYDENGKTAYPVLYLNDGQSLFDASSSQFSEYEWRVDETAELLIEAGRVRPVVIVGIDNPGRRNRPREYLPWEDVFLTPAEPSPRGRDYPTFLLDEVVPLVENRFRVLPGAEHRYLGGASYGGLITVYTATQRPEEFGGLLVESPSLYVNEAAVLDLAESVSMWPRRIYLGVGTHEGQRDCREDNYVREAVLDVRRLQALVETSRRPPEVDVVVEPCGRHSEKFYAERFPRALTFLLGSQ